jgi:hypothetical protein
MSNAKWLCLSSAAAVAAWLALAGNAVAQVPRYVPPGGSPLPSQLEYFRRDVGALDPYNSFVAPRRQLNSQLQGMAAREAADFRNTQAAISSVRQSAASPTGVSAGFMNYSHYYTRGAATRVAGRR